MNLFVARVLFCLFAEGSGILGAHQFTDTVINWSDVDGANTDEVITHIFDAMSIARGNRASLPAYADAFDYVNGGLFEERTQVPVFNKRALRLLKECGELSWKEINPDIFGSMIQAVAEPGLRVDMGMHYTSVPNILKLLQPLFLLSLESDFDKAGDDEKKLRKLLDRLYRIRVFDPACGSGNFLIIAYKELRRLETRVFAKLKTISKQWSLPLSGIRLDHFSGIELVDFAVQTAKLSLWIAEHQMNQSSKEIFGSSPPSLPLQTTGRIRQGNAAAIDWATVAPYGGGLETYIVGNPPYVWSGDQTADQKADLDCAFAEQGRVRILDYVSVWFKKSAEFIQAHGADAGLVSTNSICQGEQAGTLWPALYEHGIEISFAHQQFKWRNLAAHNAGVSCVIIGLRRKSDKEKRIYSGDHSRVASQIGPYLIEMKEDVVKKQEVQISGLPEMVRGNMPYDGGNLILSPSERRKLLEDRPDAAKFVRRLYGSQEVIKGVERWCLWISDGEVQAANAIPPIKERIDTVRDLREGNADASVVRMAEKSHQFREFNLASDFAIVIPAVSSEEREVLPVVVLDNASVVTNRCYQVIDPPIYLFSLLASRMHYVWANVVGGKLETRFNYSNTVIYNTFPMPTLSDRQRADLEAQAFDILSVREGFPGKTLAWLYGATTMPEELVQAHSRLDKLVEHIYAGQEFRSDSDRFEHLFRLYTAARRRAAKAAVRKTSPN